MEAELELGPGVGGDEIPGGSSSAGLGELPELVGVGEPRAADPMLWKAELDLAPPLRGFGGRWLKSLDTEGRLRCTLVLRISLLHLCRRTGPLPHFS